MKIRDYHFRFLKYKNNMHNSRKINSKNLDEWTYFLKNIA